jgi:hypothetical protein
MIICNWQGWLKTSQVQKNVVSSFIGITRIFVSAINFQQSPNNSYGGKLGTPIPIKEGNGLFCLQFLHQYIGIKICANVNLTTRGSQFKKDLQQKLAGKST